MLLQKKVWKSGIAVGWLIVLGAAVAFTIQMSRAEGPVDGPPGDAISFGNVKELRLGPAADVINGERGVPRGGEILSRWAEPDVAPKMRDATAINVYSQRAPAVVIVKLANGHGTGFVVDPRGWIITNHHVAAESLPDPASGAESVEVLFGKMEEGWMKLNPVALKALVYKLSETEDLALLKLQEMPEGVKALATLPLAKKEPIAGEDCFAIGHPAAGTLWSIRMGRVTGRGVWPDDTMDAIMSMLILKGPQRERLADQLKKSPKRNVLVTDVGLNSGDSGGPLLNRDGEVVGVSFAMPTFDEHHRQGTTSYHIALEDLRAFLVEKPTQPVVMSDPWPDSALAKFLDTDGDGIPDALVFSAGEETPWKAILFDLKQASTPGVTVRQLADPRQRAKWQYQFAMHRGNVLRTFYDTADTGKIDLILAGDPGKGTADVAIRLQDGRWQAEPARNRPLLDPGNFSTATLRKRMIDVFRHLRVAAEKN